MMVFFIISFTMLKDGIKIRVCTINGEILTHFSQFFSVNV